MVNKEITKETSIGHECWLFTWFNYDVALLDNIKTDSSVRYFICQSELCPKTNKSHLQCYIRFHKVQRFSKIHKLCGQKVHCDYSEAKNLIFNTYYCSKSDSYDETVAIRYMSDKTECGDLSFYWGRFASRSAVKTYVVAKSKTDRETKIKSKVNISYVERNQGKRNDLVELKKFLLDKYSYNFALMQASDSMLVSLVTYKTFAIDYINSLPRKKCEWFFPTYLPFQSDILEMISQPADDRTIVFIVDHEGKSGKSRLAEYLLRNYQAFLCCGKVLDIAKLYNYENLIICDVPRVTSDHINYQALEYLKNGVIVSGKFEPCNKMRDVGDNAHIFVFMNQYPNVEVLSRDRYRVYDLYDSKLVDVTKEFISSKQCELDDLSHHREFLSIEKVIDGYMDQSDIIDNDREETPAEYLELLEKQYKHYFSIGDKEKAKEYYKLHTRQFMSMLK